MLFRALKNSNKWRTFCLSILPVKFRHSKSKDALKPTLRSKRIQITMSVKRKTIEYLHGWMYPEPFADIFQNEPKAAQPINLKHTLAL
ncbi:MAG TPA: hypothetical protein DCZ48_10775 [Methylococcaceae bacterium]|nr:hypothetical protein [Methylococcaceae bacterium]